MRSAANTIAVALLLSPAHGKRDSNTDEIHVARESRRTVL